MAELNSDNIKLTLAPQEQAVIVRGGMTVRFTENGGVTVQQDGVTIFPPANDSVPVPKAPAPEALTPGWLTKKFIAGCKTGDELPDGTVYVRDRKGCHWAMAAEVASPRGYGRGKDLGPVGEFIEELNTKKAHGHSDWKTPDSNAGYALYDGQHEGKLKELFASVRGLWLAEPSDNYASVQWFGFCVQTLDGYRYDSNSVCAVRRLDI